MISAPIEQFLTQFLKFKKRKRWISAISNNIHSKWIFGTKSKWVGDIGIK